jgi:hypothetical protein
VAPIAGPAPNPPPSEITPSSSSSSRVAGVAERETWTLEEWRVRTLELLESRFQGFELQETKLRDLVPRIQALELQETILSTRLRDVELQNAKLKEDVQLLSETVAAQATALGSPLGGALQEGGGQ